MARSGIRRNAIILKRIERYFKIRNANVKWLEPERNSVALRLTLSIVIIKIIITDFISE